MLQPDDKSPDAVLVPTELTGRKGIKRHAREVFSRIVGPIEFISGGAADEGNFIGGCFHPFWPLLCKPICRGECDRIDPDSMDIDTLNYNMSGQSKIELVCGGINRNPAKKLRIHALPYRLLSLPLESAIEAGTLRHKALS